MEYIRDKVVIVTGGAGGIGRGVVERLLSRGAKVSICDILFEDCKVFADEMKRKYATEDVLPLKLDVTQIDSFQAVFDETKRILGVVDIMINNAGIHNEQNYLKTIETNVIGVMHGTEMALAEMAKAGKKDGTVVNVSSRVGVYITPTMPHYSASKAAIIHYSRALGDNYHFMDTGVRVLCICPTHVETPIFACTEKNTFNEKTSATIKKQNPQLKKMSPCEFADALLKFIEEGKSGDVVVKDTGKDIFTVPPYKNVLELPGEH